MLYDRTKPDRMSEEIAEQHQLVWKALTTTKGGKLASAQQRLHSLSAMNVGAMMAIMHLINNDNPSTSPFLTCLGLPTTVLEGSGATLKQELFQSTEGTLMPLGILGCPMSCQQPILTMVLTQTRGLLPIQIKLKLWKHVHLSLLLLDGDSAVAPLLLPTTGDCVPLETGDMGHGMFLQEKEDLDNNLGGDAPPPRILNGRDGTDDQLGFGMARDQFSSARSTTFPWASPWTLNMPLRERPLCQP